MPLFHIPQRVAGEMHAELMRGDTARFLAALESSQSHIAGTDLARWQFFYRLCALASSVSSTTATSVHISTAAAPLITTETASLHVHVLDRLRSSAVAVDYRALLSTDERVAVRELRSRLNDSNVAMLARLASRIETLRIGDPLLVVSAVDPVPLFSSSRVYCEHARAVLLAAIADDGNEAEDGESKATSSAFLRFVRPFTCITFVFGFHCLFSTQCQFTARLQSRLGRRSRTHVVRVCRWLRCASQQLCTEQQLSRAVVCPFVFQSNCVCMCRCSSSATARAQCPSSA